MAILTYQDVAVAKFFAVGKWCGTRGSSRNRAHVRTGDCRATDFELSTCTLARWFGLEADVQPLLAARRMDEDGGLEQ